jgi:ribosomal protein S19
MRDYKKLYLVTPNFARSESRSETYLRSAFITFSIVGQKFMVYSGQKFKSVTPRENIVGTRLGHYVFTTFTGFSIHKRKRKKKEKKKRGSKKKLYLINGYQ